MELFSADYFTALLTIIVIDLVLGGDNAIVIGLAARNLPKDQQKKVIFWGTAGAVIVRVLATLVVVWLLKIPGLLLIGGILLIWIAYKLLTEEKGHDDVKAGQSTWAAIQTIIIADSVMGLDNVIAVGGAGHQHWSLVVIGLLVSVPIVVWGSTLFIKLIERFPIVLYIGSGVLAFTAAKMIVDEKFLAPFFAENDWLKYGFIICVMITVLVAGIWAKSKRKAAPTS